MSTLSRRRREPRSTQLRREPHEPGTATNGVFHKAYADSRNVASGTGPILVVLADDLVLVQGAARSRVTYSVPLFHLAKAVAHAPVAILAMSYRAHAGRLDRRARARLRALDAALAQLPRPIVRSAGASKRFVRALLSIVGATRAYLPLALAQASIDATALREFAATVGPAVVEVTRHATAVQLRSLHKHATQLLGTLHAAARRELEVVVAGEHQARDRNLPTQYFAHLLGESLGEERRVSYAEGAHTIEAALALVGTRRLDRDIARALFGDATRLQRDVLGDAAQEQLERRRSRTQNVRKARARAAR